MKLIVIMYSIGLLNRWLWMIFFLWLIEYIEGIIWIKAFYKYVIFHVDGSEKRDLDNE